MSTSRTATCLRSVPIWETSRLATDAMDTAVGSAFEGKVMYKELDEHISKMRISHSQPYPQLPEEQNHLLAHGQHELLPGLA